MEDSESVVQTVEIIKRPGQSLGFYIREGNGRDRWDGVFISRLAAGSVAEQNGLLKIGDEILSVNGAPVSRKRLEDVVISMSIPKRLVLAVRRNPNAASMSGDATSLGSSLSGGQPGAEEEQPPPVVVVKCPRPTQSYGSTNLGSSMMIPGHSSKSPGSDPYQQGDFYIGDQQQRYTYSSSPAGVQRRSDDYWGSLGKMGTSSALMIQTQQQGFFGGDDSGDSGLSSDNSGFFRQAESSGPSASTSLSKGGSSQGKEDSGSQQSGSQVVTFRHDEDYAEDINTAVSPNQLLQTQSFQQIQQQQQQQQSSCRPTSFNNTLSTCRAPSIERCTTGYPRTAAIAPGYQRRSCSARPDYSSDSDAYTFDHSVRQKLGAMRGHPGTAAATEFYPEQAVVGGSLDWPSHYNPRWHFSPGEYATLDRRFSYSTAAEHHLAQHQQQQRWDALDSAALAWNQRARERQTAGRDQRYMMQIGVTGTDEKFMPSCYGQEIQSGGASSSLNSLLRQFDTFSLDQARSPYLSDDLTSLYSTGGGVSSDKETYTLGRQMSLNFPYGMVAAGSGVGSGKSPPTSQMDVTRMMAASAVTNPRRRVTRKLSSTGDCGPADYAEVMEEESSATLRSLQMNLGPRSVTVTSQPQQQQQHGTVSGSSSSSSTSSHQSRTLTRNPTISTAPSTTTTSFGVSGSSSGVEAPPKSLIKAPLHIRKEAFKPYQSILPHQSSSSSSSKSETSDDGSNQAPAPPLDGCLVCHVFCGHGLVSNRAVLQDLYCVVELDSLGCARTTVHTGAMNFDWDDRFEMDLYSARYLSFSVYSYDPGQGARHRLVYGGSVHLANLVQKSAGQQQQQQQQQQHHRLALQLQPRGTLYIELLYQTTGWLYRRTPSLHLSSLFGTELATVVEREKSGRNVPLLVIRCVEEVERRGLDQVGVYRLCGSARRKQQLRDELEKNSFHIDLSPSVVGDINVVTVILKDFLKELPEPVCTGSMYHMLIEALSVQMPGDAKGNAQLMLSIVECCPKTNQETLFYLLDHLKKVTQRSSINKMTPINLSIIFGPLLFHPSTTSLATSGDYNAGNKHQLARHAELLRYLLEICRLE